MKKPLIAAASLVLAATASAQSSVTLFGTVDATLAHGSGSVASRTWLTKSGNASSRLGLRGVEDLGGAMSASFWLEADVGNDDGTGGATNTNNQASGATPSLGGGQGLTFNRRSTVSLAGDWGELRVGRDYTSTFWNLGDPFGVVGVGTTVIASRSLMATNSNVLVRVSNSMGYFLPATLGGVYGNAQYYLGENPHNGAANQRDGTGWNFRLGYVRAPFDVVTGYNQIRLTSAAGADNELKTWNLLGRWTLGDAVLRVAYQRDRQSNVASGRGGLAGVAMPLGSSEIKFSYSTYRVDNLAAAASDPKATKIALGYVYNLSKRTALYATYARVRNSGGSAVALNGSTTAANAGSTGYDLGLRHNF